MLRFVSFREKLRRDRAQIRAQLTTGERVFFYIWTGLGLLLPPVGGVLIGAGNGTRGVGTGLLVVAVVLMAVPITPILKARIRGGKEPRSPERRGERCLGRGQRGRAGDRVGEHPGMYYSLWRIWRDLLGQWRHLSVERRRRLLTWIHRKGGCFRPRVSLK